MTASGQWEVTVQTPMGAQDQVYDFREEGGTLTGTVTGQMGKLDIYEGKVDGDTLSWKMDMTQPFAIKFDITAKVDGDSISGEYKMAMGVSKMSGVRKA